MTLALVITCALGAGVGLCGALASWSVPGGSETSLGGAPRVPRPAGSWARRVLAPLAVGLVVGLVTRWPVAALLGALGAYGVPSLLGQTAWKSATARVEGVAAWTELLRDTLASSAGLSQAIVATAPVAPRSIREAVQRLAARLSSGVPMASALRRLGEEIDDESADLVVCALVLASEARAQRLGELLGDLAQSAREQAAMRLRVEASRASTRSGVRTVLVFSLSFAALLAVVAHSYLAPFGTPLGQVVLAGVGLAYAAGLVLMVRMAAPPPVFRLLEPSTGGVPGEPERR